MRDIDSMTIVEGVGGYSLGLVNETLFSPESTDNSTQYSKFCGNQSCREFKNSTLHGIFLIQDGEIKDSACVCSSGGHTGIHATGCLWDGNRFLICCANSIFCLTVSSLELEWMTEADSATCFEIFAYDSGYIVHGELEITRLDASGQIIWQFGGPDIFTTPTGKDVFKLNGHVIEAAVWDGTYFVIDARTGRRVGG